MNVSKLWVFIAGVIVGAVFLGDSGGDAIKEMFAAGRAAVSQVFQTGGGGVQEFGGAIGE